MAPMITDRLTAGHWKRYFLLWTTTTMVAAGLLTGLAISAFAASVSGGSQHAAITGVSRLAATDVQGGVSGLPYGSDTCMQGYVWREAIPSDHVCVTPATRQQAQDDNGQASARRDPTGPYGPDTCMQGYVWRDAFANDHVCVTPATRQQAQDDNRHAAERLATSAGSGQNRSLVGNVQLSSNNVACTYVPHGNTDGSDGLTVFAYVLLIGANRLPGPLQTSMSISNGYSKTYTGDPNNYASKAFQGRIRTQDWGTQLVVHLYADAQDQYRETNEKDNSIQVSIALPATRPSRTIDPLRCIAQRA
jgi:hypothetical protein